MTLAEELKVDTDVKNKAQEDWLNALKDDIKQTNGFGYKRTTRSFSDISRDLHTHNVVNWDKTKSSDMAFYLGKYISVMRKFLEAEGLNVTMRWDNFNDPYIEITW
jgi:hypothetical protein